jgi:hypothetical protein
MHYRVPAKPQHLIAGLAGKLDCGFVAHKDVSISIGNQNRLRQSIDKAAQRLKFVTMPAARFLSFAASHIGNRSLL